MQHAILNLQHAILTFRKGLGAQVDREDLRVPQGRRGLEGLPAPVVLLVPVGRVVPWDLWAPQDPLHPVDLTHLLVLGNLDHPLGLAVLRVREAPWDRVVFPSFRAFRSAQLIFAQTLGVVQQPLPLEVLVSF